MLLKNSPKSDAERLVGHSRGYYLSTALAVPSANRGACLLD
jgi:hypothetical protein